MNKFCKKRKIKNSIRQFLIFKSDKNQYFPDSLRFLMAGIIPNIIFANSKTCMNFYSTLDADVKREIFNYKTLKKYQAIAFVNDDVGKYINTILKKDYFWRNI